ncbi:MAG: Ig-like domain-containing protein, partial [Oceanisphaera sp.]|nr:Ig-like domain-containing protein [Oceanisphaera sp.]
MADTLDMTITGTVVLVTSVEIHSPGGASEVISGESLQLSATVLPANASNPALSWSVLDGTGTASISPAGLLTGGNPGDVQAIASATDGSGMGDTLDLTINPPIVLVSLVQIHSPGGVSELMSGESLQLTVTVLPVNATQPAVSWSVNNVSGTASISPGGLLTGGNPGLVELIALATDASGEGDTLNMTITQPTIPVSSISISTAGGVTEIEGGTQLPCTATVLPADATNPAVAWSVINGTGTAVISTNGLLTAINAGTVDVVATALDGSGISQSLTINISTSVVLVSSVAISSADGVRAIEEGETLQFFAEVSPANATNPAVTWSVNPGTGTASITQDGLLTAASEGSVLVRAMSQDGSGAGSNFALTINTPSTFTLPVSENAIRIFPNPTSGRLYLDVGDWSPDKLEVYSLVGTRIREEIPEPGK